MGRKLVWGEGANRANQEPVTANKTSTAGARTSVAARWAFVGRPPSRWAENQSGSARPPSAGRPSEPTVRLGPETGGRGGGPPCPLRWAFVGRQPRGGAGKRPGSARPRRRGGRSNRTLHRQPAWRARGVSPRRTTRLLRPHPAAGGRESGARESGGRDQRSGRDSTKKVALSPSPQPSPAGEGALFGVSRFAGEGARAAVAAGV